MIIKLNLWLVLVIVSTRHSPMVLLPLPRGWCSLPSGLGNSLSPVRLGMESTSSIFDGGAWWLADTPEPGEGGTRLPLGALPGRGPLCIREILI